MRFLPSLSVLVVNALVAVSTERMFASAASAPFNLWDYELVINVSLASGNDTLECLSGFLPCQTLAYALRGLENDTAIVLEEGDHEFLPSDKMRVSGVRNVAIVAGETGERSTTVTCEDGAGVAFVASRDVAIYGVRWRECAIAHPSSALHHKLGVAYPATSSALFFHRCLNVTVENCAFTSRNGSGVSLYDVGGHVIVRRSNFTGHSATECGKGSEPCFQLSRGLTIEFTYCGEFKNCSQPASASGYNSGASYTVEDCIFLGNNNTFGAKKPVDSLEESEYWPYGKGGGMAVAFRGRSAGNVVAVTYSARSFEVVSPAFSQNAADVGGSLAVEFLDEASGNNFSWIGPAEASLSSAEVGGAVHLSVGVWLQRSKGNENSFLMRDIAVVGNQATWGGGFTLFNLPSSDGSASVSFRNCSWRLNSAKTGADAVGMSQLSTAGISGMTLTFSNCSFAENDFFQSAGSFGSTTYQTSQNFAHCSISTDGLAVILDTTTISNSSGPGLCVSSTVVHVKGDVRFVSNGLRTRPVCGGGLLLQSSSSVVLSKGVRLLFENNTALYYGGGIYYGGASATLPRGQRYSQSTCVFDYEDALVPVEEWSTETRVAFNNNQVVDPRGAGRGMYLAGTVDDECKLAMVNVTKGSPKEDFASTGTSVLLHPPAERVGSNVYKMEVMYGQYLTLNATATDHYDNVVEMMLRLVSLDPKTMQPVVTISGLTSLVVRDGPIYTTMFLQYSNGGMSEAYLLLTDLVNTYASIHINFITKLGFVFDSSSRIYSCFTSERMVCNRTTLEVCVQKGYWYGEIGTGNRTANAIAPCSPEHCQYDGGRCSTPCDDLSSFCPLSDNQDDQCTNNRGGVLCSRCKDDHSFTYDAVQCVSSRTCSASHTVFFVVCIVVFWAVIAAFALIILKLNMKLGAGCTFSFIYYYSIVRLVLPSQLPSLFLTVFVDVFSGMTQLNPHFLGLVQWCAFRSLGSLGYWVLRYLHPFVFLLLTLVTSILKCGCERFPYLRRVPYTHILCILLIVTFSSLTEISLKLLTPVSISNRLFVSVEPSIEYLDQTRHLPWAFLALVIECVLLLPTATLLVFGPLLVKQKWSWTAQLRGVLGEYQVCYKRGFRWAAAFYFLARQAMFLVPVLCWSADVSSVYFLQVLTVFLAVFHTALQPYKMAWLNAVDALLLFDLAFVALLNNTGLPAFAKSILIHALVILPCAYPAAVFAWLGATKLRSRLKSSCDEFSDGGSIMADRTSKDSDFGSSNQLRYESLIDRQPRKDHYHSISIL